MNLSFIDVLWILFILATILPTISQRNRDIGRYRLMRSIEKKRGSRVITLIHRQESMSLLGIPISRHINIEDSEQILRAIRLTDPRVPIDIVLHTPGGLVLATEQIAHAIRKHPAKVTVFVPHYAMSGGTLLALAADEIILDPNAVLGPVDPQLGRYPAASILSAVSKKPISEVDDETLILADMAQKAMSQVRSLVMEILTEKMTAEEAGVIADALTSGKWTHDYPITCEELRTMGLGACNDMPDEIYELMDLYPQPPSRRPSVQYVPIPYGDSPNGGKDR